MNGPAYINEQLWPLCRPITWFRPDPQNAREHPEENIAAVMASLRRFKQQKNVVALDDGTVIAGNGTLEASKALGWKHLAAVTFPSREEAVAYAVADNRTAELAVWGPNLKASMEEIARLNIPLTDVGFVDDAALRRIMVQEHDRAVGNELKSSTQPIISYTLVFDDDAQQQRWFLFIRHLKKLHPEAGTIAERLDTFLQEHQPSAEP